MRRPNYPVVIGNSFGEVIRNTRMQHELTQKQLAEKCGNEITPMYISQIEKGDRIPKTKVCRLLAKALNLNEDQLTLLAYRSNMPEEIREQILPKQTVIPLSEKCQALLKAFDSLPAEKQEKVWDFLQHVVDLVDNTTSAKKTAKS